MFFEEAVYKLSRHPEWYAYRNDLEIMDGIINVVTVVNGKLYIHCCPEFGGPEQAYLVSPFYPTVTDIIANDWELKYE